MSRAFRLGLFVVGTLVILAAGIFMVGEKQFLFSPTFHLKATFGSVAGLTDGAEVRVGGIHEGTVKRIELPKQPDQKVTVMMDLETETRQVIMKDSIASIETEGLLGNKFVSISFGTKDAGRVNDGDTIAAAPPFDISDMIKKANDIMDTTKLALKNVDDATGNLKSISAKIDQGKGTVGELVNDKKLYAELVATTAEAHETVTQAKAGVTSFAEDMQALKHNFFLRGYFRRRGYTDSTELTKDEITNLPGETPLKTFVFDANKLFDKPDTAELKNKKALKEAGEFLEQNKFGLAVVVAYAGMKGDSQKDLVLTQARAMVVRDFLAESYELDDSLIKTIGEGKNLKAGLNDNSRIEIIVYPVGAEKPPAIEKAAQTNSAPIP